MTEDEDRNNFHKYRYSYVKTHRDEISELRSRHLSRANGGSSKWNIWAEKFQDYINQNSIDDAFIDFRNLKIKKSDFEDFIFPVAAIFNRSTFTKDAKFFGATFKGMANFREVEVNGIAFFNNANFEEDAVFSHAKMNSLSLDNTKFNRKIPDLRHIQVASKIYLSTTSIPDVRTDQLKNQFLYRKLKEISIDSREYNRELEFFANESRAIRTGIYQHEFLKNSEGKLLFGCKILLDYLYDFFSNYGQSISRPLFSLLFIHLLFWAIYYSSIALPQNLDLNYEIKSEVEKIIIYKEPKVCKEPKSYTTFLYSINSSLPFIPISDEEKKEMKQCLFGKAIPPIKIKLLSILQFIISTSLVFLIILGLRNRFSISS